MWLARNQIPPASEVVSCERGIETCRAYTPAASEVSVCAAAPPFAIEIGGDIYDGGGHAWPGGVKVFTSGGDIPTDDIDASGAIWDFFSRHPMPEERGARLSGRRVAPSAGRTGRALRAR